MEDDLGEFFQKPRKAKPYYQVSDPRTLSACGSKGIPYRGLDPGKEIGLWVSRNAGRVLSELAIDSEARG